VDNTLELRELLPEQLIGDIRRNYPATWMMIVLASRKKVLGMHVEVTVSHYMKKNKNLLNLLDKELKSMTDEEVLLLTPVFEMIKERYDKLFDLSEGENSIECFKNNRISKNVVILSLVSNILVCLILHRMRPWEFEFEEVNHKFREYYNLLEKVLVPVYKHIPKHYMYSVIAVK
jgi:hypothetical protein